MSTNHTPPVQAAPLVDLRFNTGCLSDAAHSLVCESQGDGITTITTSLEINAEQSVAVWNDGALEWVL